MSKVPTLPRMTGRLKTFRKEHALFLIHEFLKEQRPSRTCENLPERTSDSDDSRLRFPDGLARRVGIPTRGPQHSRPFIFPLFFILPSDIFHSLSESSRGFANDNAEIVLARAPEKEPQVIA